MKIAIQAADLDAPRIDGTRVYIKNMLKYFGTLDRGSRFLIYHKKEFNPELVPPNFPNYEIKKADFPCLWTQVRFCLKIWQDKPDVLWMPMHNIPILAGGKIKKVVTIHDLAFEYFPKTFTRKDLFKIRFLTNIAVRRADKIIAVSEFTKKDILKFYPGVSEKNIKVISHGFDRDIFLKSRNIGEEEKIKSRLGINGKYILYVGALQPRKNLETLIEAFEVLKKNEKFKDFKLVLAGEKAWLWDQILQKIENSSSKKDIIVPGKIKFEDLGNVMRGASLFVFPSFYEGFGIPILEAFAASVPVISAKNSSLPEVGGEAALYFETENSSDLAEKMEKVLGDEEFSCQMVQKGLERIKKFSWEKCAQETLKFIKSE